MKNLRQELFDFKKTLTSDFADAYAICNIHFNETVNYSELEIINSLNDKLAPYTYDKSVKSFLEGLNNDIAVNKLSYELKNLYHILDRKSNQDAPYLVAPMDKIMEIHSIEDESTRISKIINELSMYDYVPEIKSFIANLSSNPIERKNYISNGQSNDVYSIVEQIGHNEYLTFIKDTWFLFKENNIDKTSLESHIKDEAKLKSLKYMEVALLNSEITNERINFKINEDLTVGFSTEGSTLYLNETEMNEDTTLETLFETSIIHSGYANYYPIMSEMLKNKENIYHLDIVTKVTNITNPHLECFAFNLPNGNAYVYNCDRRFNKNAFYEYKNVVEAIHEIQSELNYDLTMFYEDKLKNDVVALRKLEDTEKVITLQLEKINFNIEKLQINIDSFGKENEDISVLETALNKLTKRKEFLNQELFKVLEEKSNIKKCKDTDKNCEDEKVEDEKVEEQVLSFDEIPNLDMMFVVEAMLKENQEFENVKDVQLYLKENYETIDEKWSFVKDNYGVYTVKQK